jgi:hypothetical protein
MNFRVGGRDMEPEMAEIYGDSVGGRWDTRDTEIRGDSVGGKMGIRRGKVWVDGKWM